jgi:predicted permease
MESVFLSVLGGALGTAAVFALPDIAPQPDFRVLMFSIAITILTGIVFGIAPAVTTSRVELFTMLKQQKSQPVGPGWRFRSGKILVTTQVALSLLLLVGAGLFSRTYFNLRTTDLGFNPENLVTFRMNPLLNGYQNDRLRMFYEDALKRIESLPGVRSASISRWGTLANASSGESICVPGSDRQGAATHNVTPRYFETMGIPLLIGRDIQWSDRKGSLPVVVVNEAFAAHFYGNANPIGASFRMNCRPGPGTEVQIVGVVANARYTQIRANPPRTVYVPYMQNDERFMTFAVRTARDPAASVAAIRGAISAIDPNLPMYEVRTQLESVAMNVQQERVFAALLVSCSVVSLILACIGIYGTLTYLVNRRVSEIGIRMALGALRWDVIRLVVRESLTPVAAGIVLGLSGSLLLTRMVQSMLFEISPRDPVTLAGAALFLILIAALAAFLPARSASRIDPMIALRHE